MRMQALMGLTMIGLLVLGGQAHADTRFGVGGMFGFGGEGEVEVDAGPIGGSSESDFDPTVGFNLWVDTTLSSLVRSGTWTRYLRFGGEARFLFWETEDQQDKSVTMEFCPVAKLSFPIKRDIDLFVRFAPGFSVMLPSDDLQGFDTGFGFNIALLAGGTYQLTSQVGVLAELGFIIHNVYGDLTAGDYSMSGTQFHLDFGLTF